jgi:hypothetical protein
MTCWQAQEKPSSNDSNDPPASHEESTLQNAGPDQKKSSMKIESPSDADHEADRLRVEKAPRATDRNSVDPKSVSS